MGIYPLKMVDLPIKNGGFSIAKTIAMLVYQRGAAWFPSHASVDHDDLSGSRLAQRGQNSQEVTVHRNRPRHAHHAVTCR